MMRIIFCWIFSFLLFTSIILSQDNIRFNHLSVEDGLSQSSVTCILQDKQGFLWFGTQDGLNRYDGYNFKIFKNDPSDKNSLNNNFIFTIWESNSGNLYVETQNGVVHQYIALTESFLVVEKDSIDLNHAKVSTVGALLRESSGIVWTGGLGKATGLKRTDTRTGEITIFNHDSKNPNSLSNDKVYSIYRDRSEVLWIGTFNGLDRFDEKTGKFYHYRNDPNNPNSLPGNWVWPIYEDSHGNLWIGTVNAGLCQFDRKTNRFINYKNDPNNETSLSNNFVFSIYEDHGGLIWIGTNLGGLSYFNPSNQTIEHYKHNPENPNSISEDIILSMMVDSKGFYWIGTRNKGLNKFDYYSKKFTRFLNNPTNPNSINSNSIQSILEDKSGKIWIGSYSSGLDSFDPKTGVFKHYIHDPLNDETISDNRIYSLVEDYNGNIWIGTYGGGLNKLNRKSGKIKSYKHDKNDSTSISSNSAWSVALDDFGNVWIGSFGSGASVFDAEKQIFHQFKNNPSDSTTIIDDIILRIFKDSKGIMWFGTSKGLSKYLRQTNDFKNYDEKNGLANSFVYGIVEDDKGNLWISTNNGLSRFDPENEIFRNYYYKDGFQGNEYNQSSFAKDKITGKLLFGGLNGFNIFHPDSIIDNTYLPPIEFTGYLRYNTDDEEGKPILEKGISESDSIFLTYKDNIITLEFAALSYYNNFNNQYKYKLEGFNENWIQLGNNHSVTFTNLSPGKYKLLVIGSNNDGIWNEDGKSLYIFVSPPWWKTNIAYGLYFITFFSLLYGLRRFEINRREQKAQIRESALRIKATEAENRALEVENERKAKELEDARQMQLSMLPKELPNHPDLEIAAFMRTATEVGGDYYDFNIQEDGILNVAFGDATGHGLKAGTMVTLMKGFFTSDSAELGLQGFMTHCSNMIKEIKLGRILMSFTYLKISNKKLQFTSGGMPPIFYYSQKSKQVEELLIQGMPLGAMRNAQYKTSEKELNSGDSILLLTDGLAEQMNKAEEMFDYSRIKKYFIDNIDNSPDVIIEKLVKAGDDWMNGRIQDDDITFVIIKVN